jgi:hypothetical protein
MDVDAWDQKLSETAGLGLEQVGIMELTNPRDSVK